jgi:hypothetical protein
VLLNNGNVSKFLRGVTDKFNSPQLPAPDNGWRSPQAIFTSSADDHIYIQDSDKIVETTKLGDYQGQFTLADKPISSAYISEKTKTGWVLSADKIYQFSLK